MPMWAGFIFQDGCSYIIDSLIFFHDHVIFVLIIVRALALYFIIISESINIYIQGVNEGHEIEFIWTVLPVFLLVLIAFPSLKILYIIDEDFVFSLTYKVVGHQWYWSYEYSDFLLCDIDSFILSTEGCRLLDTEDRLYGPWGVPLRMLVTSQDVIHSWTIPRIGVKSDAVPGRLNQLIFLVNRPGLYFGQCSELCGANHSFIPISLEVNRINNFTKLFG